MVAKRLRSSREDLAEYRFDKRGKPRNRPSCLKSNVDMCAMNVMKYMISNTTVVSTPINCRECDCPIHVAHVPHVEVQ